MFWGFAFKYQFVCQDKKLENAKGLHVLKIPTEWKYHILVHQSALDFRIIRTGVSLSSSPVHDRGAVPDGGAAVCAEGPSTGGLLPGVQELAEGLQAGHCSARRSVSLCPPASPVLLPRFSYSWGEKDTSLVTSHVLRTY